MRQSAKRCTSAGKVHAAIHTRWRTGYPGYTRAENYSTIYIQQATGTNGVDEVEGELIGITSVNLDAAAKRVVILPEQALPTPKAYPAKPPYP